MRCEIPVKIQKTPVYSIGLAKRRAIELVKNRQARFEDGEIYYSYDRYSTGEVIDRGGYLDVLVVCERDADVPVESGVVAGSDKPGT